MQRVVGRDGPEARPVEARGRAEAGAAGVTTEVGAPRVEGLPLHGDVVIANRSRDGRRFKVGSRRAVAVGLGIAVGGIASKASL